MSPRAGSRCGRKRRERTEYRPLGVVSSSRRPVFSAASRISSRSEAASVGCGAPNGAPSSDGIPNVAPTGEDGPKAQKRPAHPDVQDEIPTVGRPGVPPPRLQFRDQGPDFRDYRPNLTQALSCGCNEASVAACTAPNLQDALRWCSVSPASPVDPSEDRSAGALRRRGLRRTLRGLRRPQYEGRLRRTRDDRRRRVRASLVRRCSRRRRGLDSFVGPAPPATGGARLQAGVGRAKARIDFTRWDLAPLVAEGTFTFQPRADYTRSRSSSSWRRSSPRAAMLAPPRSPRRRLAPRHRGEGRAFPDARGGCVDEGGPMRGKGRVLEIAGVAAIAAIVLATWAVPAAEAQRHRDRGVNQPGATGNRAGVDPGLNQPGAAGNVGRDPGLNQPGGRGQRGLRGIGAPGARRGSRREPARSGRKRGRGPGPQSARGRREPPLTGRSAVVFTSRV